MYPSLPLWYFCASSTVLYICNAGTNSLPKTSSQKFNQNLNALCVSDYETKRFLTALFQYAAFLKRMLRFELFFLH